jgi:hypothetical protein
VSAFSDSYVLRVLFTRERRGTAAGRYHRLAACLFDPYRPELHYMRGPGPKWRAKHKQPPA